MVLSVLNQCFRAIITQKMIAAVYIPVTNCGQWTLTFLLALHPHGHGKRDMSAMLRTSKQQPSTGAWSANNQRSFIYKFKIYIKIYIYRINSKFTINLVCSRIVCSRSRGNLFIRLATFSSGTWKYIFGELDDCNYDTGNHWVLDRSMYKNLDKLALQTFNQKLHPLYIMRET